MHKKAVKHVAFPKKCCILLYMVKAIVPWPSNLIGYTMAKVSTTTAPVVSAAPVVSTATISAAKQARYAPAAVIVPNAVITHVAPNPKKGKSALRYAQFYQVGITVEQFVAAYKAAGLKGMLARADLRWDLQHGFITLG
jgi:hypothetical protein